MSVENATSFIKKVSEDDATYLEVRKVTPKDLDGLQRVAAGAGLTFTAEEWHAAVAQIGAASSAELGDGDLDQVTGGTLTSFSSVTLAPVLSSFTTGGLVAKCKCAGSLTGMGGFGSL